MHGGTSILDFIVMIILNEFDEMDGITLKAKSEKKYSIM